MDLAVRKKEDGGSSRAVLRLQAMTNIIMWTLHLVVSVITPLAIPVLLSTIALADPLPLGALTFTSIVTSMKLISYAMCNADLRYAPRTASTLISVCSAFWFAGSCVPTHAYKR